MKHRILLIAAIALLVLSIPLACSSHVALAQSGGGYDLTWSTIDGGGAMFSTGGGYSLGGTAGQPDVRWMLTGAGYTLGGGFWGSGATMYAVYLPVVLRNP